MSFDIEWQGKRYMDKINKMDKISVITIVYNDSKHIRQTMESFFSQTWKDKEYIVIDGGSKDGTADIIKEYSDKLTYWCSEPDKGIYDAMNKGISHATGEWINFLNCGDYFCSPTVLENMLEIKQANTDVIYGNGIWFDGNRQGRFDGADDIQQMDWNMAFRHGCSLIKTSVHKQYMYETNKKDVFGWALDYDAIFRMYHDGCVFQKVNVDVEFFELDGVSNNQLESLKYNRRITSQYGGSYKKDLYYIHHVIVYYLNKLYIYRWLKKMLLHRA